jgi:hypothetical protein
MRRILQFVRDSGGWGVASELTGLVTFGIGLWEHSQDRALRGFVFVAISVPLFWIGAFVAWNRKRDQLWKEQSAKYLKAEWRLLEEKFGKRYPNFYTACWTLEEENPKYTWKFEGMDGDPIEKKKFEALLEEAGNLLVTSRFAREAYMESLSATAPVDRWLNVVAAMTDRNMQDCGATTVQGKKVETYGHFSDLPRLCALTCAGLAAKEKMAEPSD